MINAYELVFILKEDKEQSLKTITDLVESKKGKVTKTDKWGKKNLSYPIQKLTSGYYYILTFETDKSNIPDFKKKLDFNEDLLRYLLLTV